MPLRGGLLAPTNTAREEGRGLPDETRRLRQTEESPESLVAGIPNLSPSERQHPFFLKGACPVTLGLGGITEGQRFLVRRCRVGGWTVLECLNCHLLTHATRGVGGDVAASALLISDANKIQMLQKCDGYSPVFNLVLPTALDSQSPPPLSPTEFPGDRSPETDAALSDIQQQMTRFLKKAQSQVEANIQSYTKQQQAALQALTYRARQDRQTVMRLISNMQANLHSQAEDDVLCGFDMDGARPRQSDPFSTHSRMGLGEAEDGLDDDVPGLREESEGEIPPLVSLQVRGNSQPLTMNHAQGVTCGVWLTVARLTSHSVVLPDSIIGEGMHIPGGRDSIRDLAKSVPVNVPMWAAARAKPMPEPRVIEVSCSPDTLA
ncbi:hypothetical protein E2C01_014872 [Portunus trituberculatus]|uniref:Uncharacterized protein n=1 Tax=Portunus trituberculatus TaxID=210409 RepID=A0A5B7DK74_PORTR|nr:hypothetical protein [Portunus trituberculatus]